MTPGEWVAELLKTECPHSSHHDLGWDCSICIEEMLKQAIREDRETSLVLIEEAHKKINAELHRLVIAIRKGVEG